MLICINKITLDFNFNINLNSAFSIYYVNDLNFVSLILYEFSLEQDILLNKIMNKIMGINFFNYQNIEQPFIHLEKNDIFSYYGSIFNICFYVLWLYIIFNFKNIIY